MLKIDYLTVPGLPPVSFDVAVHECLAVEGPSGSGKTRLLRAIADLDAADGFVFLEGVERRELPGPEWRRRVRYASAEHAWWGSSVAEHFPPSAKLDRMLSALGLAADVLGRQVAELSTGERQRLGLARAIADNPSVLLLDEPTSALDPVSAALAEELIRFQLLAGRIVVLVSHDVVQIERLAHRRLKLADLGRYNEWDSAAA